MVKIVVTKPTLAYVFVNDVFEGNVVIELDKLKVDYSESRRASGSLTFRAIEVLVNDVMFVQVHNKIKQYAIISREVLPLISSEVDISKSNDSIPFANMGATYTIPSATLKFFILAISFANTTCNNVELQYTRGGVDKSIFSTNLAGTVNSYHLLQPYELQTGDVIKWNNINGGLCASNVIVLSIT